MGNACGAGSSGAVREQRAKEGSAEQMCMDCPRFRRPTSASILTATSRAGHIPHFCDNMHKYVLRRHLKGAVDAVIATKRMGSSRLMGLFASASETPTSGAATEATPAAEAPAVATTA